MSKAVEIKVTNKEGAGFYNHVAASFLRGMPAREAFEGKEAMEAKEALDELKISGLGDAINVAIVVAASAEREGLGTITKVETSYPEIMQGRRCAQIAITVHRHPPLESEVSACSTPREERLHCCAFGHSTADCIKLYNSLFADATDCGLHANPDPAMPLYFWQLYSVLGMARIHNLVWAFYTRIAVDSEEPWFRISFMMSWRGTNWESHVEAQASFFFDAMGGGAGLFGGPHMIGLRHRKPNVNRVMTQAGAARWMHHMRLALDESDLGPDPRARDALDTFFYVMMEHYAKMFGFQTGDPVYKGPWCAADYPWRPADHAPESTETGQDEETNASMVAGMPNEDDIPECSSVSSFTSDEEDRKGADGAVEETDEVKIAGGNC